MCYQKTILDRKEEENSVNAISFYGALTQFEQYFHFQTSSQWMLMEVENVKKKLTLLYGCSFS